MKTIYTRMLVCLMALSAAINIKAQTLNSMTEVIPFKMTDGKIIIAATVNGEPADFVLDLAGHTALLPEAVKKLRIDTSKPGSFSAYQDFQFKKVATGEIYNIGTLTIGNNIFANDRFPVVSTYHRHPTKENHADATLPPLVHEAKLSCRIQLDTGFGQCLSPPYPRKRGEPRA